MKYTSIKALEKHLEESTSLKEFSPIYLLLGKDRFLSKTAANKIKKFLIPNEKNSNFSLKTLEGDTLTEKELDEELYSLSFFSSNKILLIEEIDKASKSIIKKLESYFLHPAKTLTLILLATSFASNTNFYKNAAKTGIILDLPEEKEAEKIKNLTEWVIEKIEAEGKKIDVKTAQTLVKFTRNDPSLLSQELEKILCFIDNRNIITLQDIESICSNAQVETIWRLVEAIFKRDTATALQITNSLLNNGESFFTLIRQIRNQIQTDFSVCSILANGGSSKEITELFPYMKGFILDQHISQAKTFGLTKFRESIILIDEAELKAKNSSLDHDLLLELLIIKLSAPT